MSIDMKEHTIYTCIIMKIFLLFFNLKEIQTHSLYIFIYNISDNMSNLRGVPFPR